MSNLQIPGASHQSHPPDPIIVHRFIQNSKHVQLNNLQGPDSTDGVDTYEVDPGSLAAQMDTDNNQEIENNRPHGSVLDLEDLVESAKHQNCASIHTGTENCLP